MRHPLFGMKEYGLAALAGKKSFADFRYPSSYEPTAAQPSGSVADMRDYTWQQDAHFSGNVYTDGIVQPLKAYMDPSYELLITLLAAAVQFSGLPPIHVSELPPVIMLPREELNRTVCTREPIRCTGLMAALDTKQYRILVDDKLDLNDAGDNSFLVHEIVHVLQLKHTGSTQFTSCRGVISSEREAYDVQNRYLIENRRPGQQGNMLRFARCPEEDEKPAEAVRRTGHPD